MRPLRKRRAMPSYETIGDLGTLYTSFYSDHQNVTEQLIDLEEKFHTYQNYHDETTSSFEQLLNSQEVSPNISIDTARSLGVRNKWELFNFFSQENINGNPEIFQYIDDDGSLATFSPEQIQLIKEWAVGESYPVKGIQGHHIESISDNKTNIPLAAEPDNILFATPQAHLRELHGGSFFNPTNERYRNIGFTKEEMLESTLDYNYKSQMDGVSAHYEVHHKESIQEGALSGIVVGTITGVIHLFNTQRLHHKGMIVPLDQIKHARVGVAISALKPLSVIGVKNSAWSLYKLSHAPVHETLSYKEAAMTSAVNKVTENFSEVAEIINIPSTIIGVSMINLLHTTIKQKMEKEQSYLSKHHYKMQRKVYVYEMIAFSSLGVGLTKLSTTEMIKTLTEQIVEDTAASLIIPSVGVTTIMTAYKIGKLGKASANRKKEQKAFEQCGVIHLHHLYGRAVSAAESM